LDTIFGTFICIIWIRVEVDPVTARAKVFNHRA
jgi:hypothetical protein